MSLRLPIPGANILMNDTAVPLIPTLKAKCEGGSHDLSKYPHLAYSPSQHGEGVRCASNGFPVDQIALACREPLDTLSLAANSCGVTLAELFDALRYARDTGVV